jgi:hypothetical protein
MLSQVSQGLLEKEFMDRTETYTRTYIHIPSVGGQPKKCFAQNPVTPRDNTLSNRSGVTYFVTGSLQTL